MWIFLAFGCNRSSTFHNLYQLGGFFFCQIGFGIVERLNDLLQQFQTHVIGGMMMFWKWHLSYSIDKLGKTLTNVSWIGSNNTFGIVV